MGDDKRQVVSGTIAAPPEAVFAVLADPSRHPEMDGSDMCQQCGSGPVTGVGQEFVMDMAHPQLGKYKIRNKVSAFEPGRRIAWEPSPEVLSPEILGMIGDIKVGGHSFGWELEPTGDGGTAVTHVCDWSGVGDPGYEALFPFISAEQMSQSIERLGAAAAKSTG